MGWNHQLDYNFLFHPFLKHGMKKTSLTRQEKSSACLWVAALFGSSVTLSAENGRGVVQYPTSWGNVVFFSVFSLEKFWELVKSWKRGAQEKTGFRCLGPFGFEKKASGVLEDGDTAVQITGHWTCFNDGFQNWFIFSSMLVHVQVLRQCLRGPPQTILCDGYDICSKRKDKINFIILSRVPPFQEKREANKSSKLCTLQTDGHVAIFWFFLDVFLTLPKQETALIKHFLDLRIFRWESFLNLPEW